MNSFNLEVPIFGYFQKVKDANGIPFQAIFFEKLIILHGNLDLLLNFSPLNMNLVVDSIDKNMDKTFLLTYNFLTLK